MMQFVIFFRTNPSFTLTSPLLPPLPRTRKPRPPLSTRPRAPTGPHPLGTDPPSGEVMRLRVEITVIIAEVIGATISIR
jgi:hypothetical protein